MTEAPLPLPMALLAELTYRCPLQCPYCSNPLEMHRWRDELSTAEWTRVIGGAAELGVIHVHFSGGEPLLRRDVFELIRAARDHDLYTNMSTSAAAGDATIYARLREAGLDHLQISVLDSRPEANDRLGGAKSFERKRAAFGIALDLGFAVTMNVVLHRLNLDHLEEIIDFAEGSGAHRLELAHAQYVGWAFRNREALMPTAAQLERARELADAARERLRGRMSILHVLPDYHQDRPKACMGGWGRAYVCVAPDGLALPCQTAREIPGIRFPSVRDASLREIWTTSEPFAGFRSLDWMPEPCRSCDRREIDFGGCRCQAYLLTGDARATDPVCGLSPDHGLVRAAVESAARNGKDAEPGLAFRRIAPERA